MYYYSFVNNVNISSVKPMVRYTNITILLSLLYFNQILVASFHQKQLS